MTKYDFKVIRMFNDNSHRTEKKHSKYLDGVVEQYEAMLKEQGAAIEQQNQIIEELQKAVHALQEPNRVPQIGYQLDRVDDDYPEEEDTHNKIGLKR